MSEAIKITRHEYIKQGLEGQINGISACKKTLKAVQAAAPTEFNQGWQSGMAAALKALDEIDRLAKIALKEHKA